MHACAFERQFRFRIPASSQPCPSDHLMPCVSYLNSISPCIYRDALQTFLRKPSFCVSLLKLSSHSPMARTKPQMA
jgi:hypothetical protein